MVDSNTIIASKFSIGQENDGLWIDIFPVDGLPEDINLVKKIYNESDYFRRILLLIGARLGEGKTTTRKYFKYILKPILSLYGKKRCIEKLESIAARHSYDESDFVGIVT